MIDRRPSLIARWTSAADVALAVNFARECGSILAVRCAGHNIAGFAVCDKGIVIDLSPMKRISVAAEARSVRVDAGCTWGEVTDALQPHGLAATGGFVSVTGVSGLTLGGGFGWLVRKHGRAIDNLLSAEVVLADGSHVTASPAQKADLFWGLRGGGGTRWRDFGDEGPEGVRRAYGEDKLHRLGALKAKYDPANLFRMNQNIEPATRG